MCLSSHCFFFFFNLLGCLLAVSNLFRQLYLNNHNHRVYLRVQQIAFCSVDEDLKTQLWVSNWDEFLKISTKYSHWGKRTLHWVNGIYSCLTVTTTWALVFILVSHCTVFLCNSPRDSGDEEDAGNPNYILARKCRKWTTFILVLQITSFLVQEAVTHLTSLW